MLEDCRLKGLCPGCANPPWGKVPGFRGKTVHFPSGNARGLPPGRPVPRLRRPAMGGSAQIPGENGSLSRWEYQSIASWRACATVARTSQGRKCPNPARKRFTFPVGMLKDCRLEGLCPSCTNPPGGKVPGFRGKPVHFPGGNAKGLPPGGPVDPVAQTRQGEIKGPKGRETLLQTLWRTWRGNSLSEGGRVSRENCTPAEGGKGRGREDGCLGAT